MSYVHAATQAWMLADRLRTDAFIAAIKRAVRPEDVVVDVGAGTAALAVAAAKFGARRVYAVEQTGVAGLAEKVIARNGVDSVVQLVRGDARSVNFPEPPTLIVSELLGNLGVDENIAEILAVVATRCTPDVRCIPKTCRLSLALADDRPLAVLDRALRDLAEVDLRDVAARAMATLYPSHVDPEGLVTHSAHTEVLRLPRDTTPPLFTVTCVATRNADANCVVVWFSAELDDEGTLTNEPGKPATHWVPVKLPLVPSLALRAGQPVTVDLTLRPVVRWHVTSGDAVRTGSELAGTYTADSSKSPTVTDLAEQLGLRLTPLGAIRSSPALRDLATGLGGSPEVDLETFATRLRANDPTRFADEHDAMAVAADLLRRLDAWH